MRFFSGTGSFVQGTRPRPTPHREGRHETCPYGGRRGAGPDYSVVGFGFAFCLVGFGSAMEGPGLWCRMTMAPTPTLAVRHSGRYTSAASCLIPTRAIGGLAGVEGVPGWGNPSCISARPLSGTAFGSNSQGRTESSSRDHSGAA